MFLVCNVDPPPVPALRSLHRLFYNHKRELALPPLILNLHSPCLVLSSLTLRTDTAMEALLLKLQKGSEPGNKSRPYSDDEAFSILELHLRNSMPVLETARAITAMLPNDDKPKEKEAAVALLGSFFCQMAEGLPYHNAAQTKLVQLILAVSRSHKLIYVPTSDEEAATSGQVLANVASLYWQTGR
jgi:hypothetical protein